jgi:hypothetical protein
VGGGDRGDQQRRHNPEQINLPPKCYANDQLLMILRALPFKEGYRALVGS